MLTEGEARAYGIYFHRYTLPPLRRERCHFIGERALPLHRSKIGIDWIINLIKIQNSASKWDLNWLC